MIPTTLGRIEKEDAIDLITDGYIGAMGAMHALLDTELPPELNRERFENLTTQLR